MKFYLKCIVLFISLIALVSQLAACQPAISTSMQPSTTTMESTQPSVPTTTQTTLPTTSTTTSNETTDTVSGNGSPVVQMGDWLYFAVAEMQALDQDFGLYRIRTDGSESTLLYPGFRVNLIHIVNQEVHFVQSTTVEDGTPISVQLMKTELDGSNPQTILAMDGWDIDALQFSGDWIYLGCTDETWQQVIFKVRTDGSDLTEIAQGYSLKALQGDWLYALTDQAQMVRLTLDGQDSEMIGTDRSDNWDFWVQDGWIYYISGDDPLKLYRVQIDGTNRQQLTVDPVYHYYLADGKLIYQIERTQMNMDAIDGQLVQIELNGSGSQDLINVSPGENGYAYLIGVVDGWLYCHEITTTEQSPDTYHSTLYRIRQDGTERMVLVSYECINAG